MERRKTNTLVPKEAATWGMKSAENSCVEITVNASRVLAPNNQEQDVNGPPWNVHLPVDTNQIEIECDQDDPETPRQSFWQSQKRDDLGRQLSFKGIQTPVVADIEGEKNEDVDIQTPTDQIELKVMETARPSETQTEQSIQTKQLNSGKCSVKVKVVIAIVVVCLGLAIALGLYFGLRVLVPDSPTSITTTNVNDQVNVAWSLPETRGSPITAYKVLIRQKDASFRQDSVYCRGYTTEVISTRSCSIALATLKASPYFLVKGDDVVVQVIAVNEYGESVQVVTGSGAKIQEVPEPPNLTNNAIVTSGGTIGLKWEQTGSDGGTPITKYLLESDLGNGAQSFTNIANEINSSLREFVIDQLQIGKTYLFRLQAKNAVGFSSFSNIVSILAADLPAQPRAPNTIWLKDINTVQVSWTAPIDNGSPITGYEVRIRKSDEVGYFVEETFCNMKQSKATTCQIPVETLRQNHQFQWGQSIHAKVTAFNIVGSSVESADGNGAKITTAPDPVTDLQENQGQRSKSTLGIKWIPPVFTGGDVLIEYRINYAEQGQNYQVAASVTGLSYTITGLVAGKTYQFYVESRNSYGYSAASSIITLLCAFVPDSPTTVATANVNDKVSLTWSEPITNGSPITAYKILIQQRDAIFKQESVDCRGESSDVISARSCSIALATLKASPYLLVKGNDVVAQVISVNAYGESVQVVTGSGAKIQEVPEPPVSLANDPSVTTDKVIKFTFSEGASNGGAAVNSYTILYDQGTNNFVQLESGVKTLAYQTTIPLTPATNYVFKVQAVNSVGPSKDSESLSVLAARRPDAPTSLADDSVVTKATQIGLTWSDGAYNGGSPITNYQVYFAQASSVDFTLFSTVNTRSATVTGLSSGSQYKFYVKSSNIVGQSLQSTEVTILAAQAPDAPTQLANAVGTTNANNIGLTWRAPTFNGGSAITSYVLESDGGSGGATFTVVSQVISGEAIAYTVNNLVQGTTYQFRIQAKNKLGASTYSNVVSILAAQKPAQPTPPSTTWQKEADTVVITWVAPDNGGSAISGYKVLIRQSDGLTYSVDQNNCDMKSKLETKCFVPVAVLRAQPFVLEWGSNVHARIVAINRYGESAESSDGNGAIITTKPGTVTDLQEIQVSRTKSSLALKWIAPVFTGGDVLIEYRINYAEQGQNYQVAASVTGLSYTITGLVAGKTYQFYVESRNSYGYSAASSIITLLCAFVPDSPTTVATANVNDKVSLTWSEPITNGSPITAYKILIQQRDAIFKQESVDCRGESSDVISARSCSIALATLKASPYLLVKGNDVVAQVISVNAYGESVQVVTGSGAKIQEVPEPPVSLANDPSVTTDKVIKFTFSEGASNGGAAVNSYTILYDQGTNNFVQLESGVKTLAYQTTIPLTPATNYVFKVQAVNSVGPSKDSESLSVLAARRPDAPTSLADDSVVTKATQIGLTWSDGAYNGGSPITNYQVYFAQASSVDFTLFSTVNTRSATVTGLSSGSQYKFYVKSSNIVGQSLQSTEVTILAAQAPDAPTQLANAVGTTNANNIGLTWRAPTFNGGSAITSYVLESDGGSGGATFTVVSQVISGEAIAYTVNNLVQGTTYQFRIQAKNKLGASTYSNVVSILAAQKPAQPTPPSTTWQKEADTVVITWVAPDNGGSAISGYKVLIRQSDGLTYSVDQNNCDMKSKLETKCFVPVAVLRAQPFVLEWGSNVHARIVAINRYGESAESSDGNGAIITTKPGTVTDLQEIQVSRTKSSLALKWIAPVFTGGDVLIEYRINYAEQGQNYQVAASVTGLSYTITGLVAGKTYQFYVESRNSYGYSAASSIITLLCAFVPDSPTTVATANVNDKVSLTWSEPITNGSPITAYKILIQQRDAIFKQESVDCRGESSDVISARSCSIALATLKASPYLLVKGNDVVAQVISVNAYGESVQVVTGSGAKIQEVPEPPVSLANDPSVTTDKVIKFTFSEGASNGGAAVNSYTILYDQGTNNFVQLESGVKTLAYQTTIPLTPATNYVFKVQAVNSVGPSKDSESLSVLAARRPDAPTSLADDSVVTKATQIGLTWSDGAYNGGSPITNYQVYFAQASSVDFTLFSTVNTRSATVTGLSSGSQYKFYVKSSNIVGQSLQSTEVTILAAQAPDAPTQLANAVGTTNANNIGLTWRAPTFNGGSAITSYVLESDGGSGGATFTVVSQVISGEAIAYTVNNLVQGTTYQFRIQAKNKLGASTYSNVVSILAAQKPAQPTPPSTTWQKEADTVVITWVAPDNGGSAISGYKVLIRQSDGVNYSVEQNNCDMKQKLDTKCTIPVAALRAQPFVLDWGTNVYAKVVVINSYGESAESTEGNGAVIMTLPSAPTNLVENTSQRTLTSLSLSWTASNFLGGDSQTLSYEISWGKDGSFTEAQSVETVSYTAAGLVTGSTYQFRVRSKNKQGFSSYSQTVSLLCATVPSTPNPPTTSIDASSVVIKWEKPAENGSLITEYTVQIRTSDESKFEIDSQNCDGKQESVVSSLTCTIPQSTLTNAPFTLTAGQSVYAKVAAKNVQGQSAFSGEGNGAVLS